MNVKLLTEHHLEFLSLKGGCRSWLESTLVKMSNCWKSHAAAHLVHGNQSSKLITIGHHEHFVLRCANDACVAVIVLMFFPALHALVLKVITILCNHLLPRSHALVFHCFMC